MSLDIASAEVTSAAEKGIEWLNLRSNSIEPFKLTKIDSAERTGTNITLIVHLEMFQKDHTFRLVVNPAGKGPDTLPEFKQLAP